MSVLLLVRHPGDVAMLGTVRADGHRMLGGTPRRQWLVSESAARPRVRPGSPAPVPWRRHDPPEPEDLDELLERARSGEGEAFGELFDHFHGLVFRQLLAQTRSRALAEDLTSETFFRALRAIDGFALPSPLFGPWLRRIARNLAVDHFKASRTRLELVTVDLSYFEGLVAGPEDIVMESLDHVALRTAVLRLPFNQRRVIALRFFEELSIAETSVELGCTEGAAKQLQWRGLRNLAKLMREEVPGA
jgi:RNA polymerase sigma-70 factor (ECF subfamily)